MKAPATRYPLLSIGAHWLTLLLLIATYALIELRGIFPKGTPLHDGMKTWHFMLGLTILLIVVGRITLRLLFRAPAIAPPPPAWMEALARLMHLALYAFLIVMPVLGWLTLSAKGRVIPWFGMELPPLIPANPGLAKSLEGAHEWIGNLGYWLIGLHAAAALFHHYVLRDTTLTRMLPAIRRAKRRGTDRALPSHRVEAGRPADG